MCSFDTKHFVSVSNRDEPDQKYCEIRMRLKISGESRFSFASGSGNEHAEKASRQQALHYTSVSRRISDPEAPVFAIVSLEVDGFSPSPPTHPPPSSPSTRLVLFSGRVKKPLNFPGRLQHVPGYATIHSEESPCARVLFAQQIRASLFVRLSVRPSVCRRLRDCPHDPPPSQIFTPSAFYYYHRRLICIVSSTNATGLFTQFIFALSERDFPAANHGIFSGPNFPTVWIIHGFDPDRLDHFLFFYYFFHARQRHATFPS